MNQAHLLEENNSLKPLVSSLEQQVKILTEQVEWFKRQLFGKRSERVVENSEQLMLDFQLEEQENQDQEESSATQVNGHTRKPHCRTGENSITLPSNIPVEIQILDLSEAEKENNGKPLVKIGEEKTQKLAYRPGSYFIKEMIRPKYALPNGEGIKTRELPESLIPKLRIDESLLAEIFTKKFADHLPLYRISEILSRDTVQISRKLLSQWVLKCGKALTPLYEALKKEILKEEALHVDETRLNMLTPGKGKAHQGYAWVLATEKKAFYKFYTNRKHENAVELLENYNQIVHSDKYGAYEVMATQKKFIWAPCWAHIRRKFYEAEGGDSKLRKWILRKIRYLFMLEKVAWARSPEERLRIRQTLEVPIIDEVIAKIKERLIKGGILPKSKFKEALGYMHGLIPYLKNYISHSKARLDNNVAERAIRPLAIGRKNWLFVGSEKGGHAASVFLSLIQTCRSCKINPREYLEDVMRRIMNHNSQKLHELLPEQWAAAKQ